MAYKVKVTKEIDEALENIEEYCIEHFRNYDYAQKVLNEILRVASFLSGNAGNTPLYSKHLYKYISPYINYNFYYSIDEKNQIVYLEKMLAFKQKTIDSSKMMRKRFLNRNLFFIAFRGLKNMMIGMRCI